MKNMLKATLLVLDEVLLVLLALVILQEMGVELSLPVIITVIVLAAVAILVVYRVIVSLKRKDQVGAREGMIGLHGRVVEQLDPEGVIKVRGEFWRAKCINDNSISDRDEVIIEDVEGLTLLVKRKNDA